MNRGSLLARLSRASRAFFDDSTSAFETPVASFPFLSGDTFRQMAAHVFTEDRVTHRSGLRDTLCFASGDVAAAPHFFSRAASFVEQKASNRFILLIHNGDHIPVGSDLKRLGELFSQVFCVNVVKESKNVRALPIGLENARLNNNGRLSYYLEGIEFSRSTDRSRLVASSFHTSNNSSLREPAAELFRKSRFGFDGHSWKRKEYREILKDTCFVISPPGNGSDCHRTWEAIYMGAVPVVLKGHLAQSLYENMPVLALDSYEEFLELSDEEIRHMYRAIVAKPARKAYATHWVKELC